MKKNLKISILLTVVTTVIFGIIYPLVVTGIAQVLFPKQANGELIKSGDKLIGSRLPGQPFTAAGVAKYTKGRQWGILGEPRVSGLELNLDRDAARPMR